ncbi:Wzz/FepE/Etk N-terminal domain-containing protein [Pseudomonas paracarnis]|uniref:LPS O-antigen chain length determinant protein WzzB n=1 Tax=Pseudomonas paracarnis TaxID=2750625 RepID=A0ABU6BQ21_9PSED|nr:Wzz/FepE/Etk N-terminal domain-containing protein [Pseudomonas paracarnis]KWV68426.1 cryptic autophosphorylating protein tyrosine kinase Etk [Pseudomonas fluorescens]MBW9243820.1 LPS O-antigen chain length determinant protein WzzB [Pseudomonas paracarnis]MDI3184321.1 Wzz/FepE/Etk N-terminal domain-containing protein [Pseudomonas paracarnis]MEB3781931.1 LPS O-antigen chain length determinant protein WzzB [Pseudomonas paracarnis]
MSSSFRAPPVPPSNEVDLVELFQAVGAQKKLIAVVATAVTLLAVAYAFLAKPEYQVSSVLRPAAINELDSLNRSEVYQLPPAAALIKVGAALESYETRLGFFRANQTLFKEFVRPGRTLEQSFEEFNRNSISLTLPDPNKSDLLSSYIRLDLNYHQGIDGVAILNGFVDYAIAAEREQIAADMTVIVKNRINELEGKLKAARASYDADKEARIATLREADTLKRAQLQDEIKALRTQLRTLRADRMSQLNEAISIARSLNIQKPTTPTSLGERPGTASSVMRTEINNQQIPLYFMGVEALEAERVALRKRTSDDFTEGRIAQIARELQLLQTNREIEVLNERKNEDVFLSGVQSLRAEEVRLRNLNVDMSRLKLVTIDKQALEPLGPIKPKKAMVILLGAILGLMLGLSIALVRYLFTKKRNDKAVGVQPLGRLN